VANRFALSQDGALNLERTLLAADGAGPSARRTGLLFAQGGGLLFQKGLQGAFGESSGRGAGELLHGVEIDVEPGPVVAEGASGDDFAPLGGEALELLELFGSEGAACHDASCMEVKKTTSDKIVLSCYNCDLDGAKQFMTSAYTPA
jgi:hypothetical protein